MRTTRPVFPTTHPTLTTANLILIPIDNSHLNYYHAMRTDPISMIHSISGLPDADLAATQTWIDRIKVGFSIFAEPQNQTPDTEVTQFIGNVGIRDETRPEVGYMIRRDEWGRGYCTEAIGAMLAWYWGLERKEVEVEEDREWLKLYQTVEADGSVREGVRAMIEARNNGSRRVLEKNGFKLVEGREERPEPDHRGPATLIWYYLERPGV